MDAVNIPKEWFLENPKGRLMEKFAENNLPEFYNKINKYPGNRFVERLYNYYEGNTEIPRCVCGKELKFNTFTTGYHTFCSRKCSDISPERIDKIKSTLLKKYGVDNISKLDEIKRKKEETSIKHHNTEHFNNRQKAKDTMIDRYGVDNISKLDEIKRKKEETLYRHFGGDYTPIINKIKETNLKKYGVDNVLKLDVNRRSAHDKYYNKFLTENPIIESIGNNCEDIIYKCRCPHPDCIQCNEKTFEIQAKCFNSRKFSNTELCTTLLPPQDNRIKNTTIEIFIKNILDKYGVKYEINVRNIIPPKELDIYIPDKRIAIECNGTYWHSVLQKPEAYHEDKFNLCKENNIQLLTIWEDWIITSPSKIESLIKSKLGIYDIKIGARKCIIKNVEPKDTNNFLNKYHIQGATGSSIKLGLYYNDELICIMTFGKRKLFKNNEWELIRYCCKGGVLVIGGASRLLNHFIKQYNPDEILSYSSNDISIGDLYKKLGFKKDRSSKSYWYIKNNIRYNIYNFTKSRLIKTGADKNKTEFEIMNDRGFVKIFDSGMTRWAKHL